MLPAARAKETAKNADSKNALRLLHLMRMAWHGLFVPPIADNLPMMGIVWSRASPQSLLKAARTQDS